MNGANPLDQLRGIHLPDAVSAWPPSLAWWLVLLTLMAAAWSIIWLIKKRRYKRSALKALKQLEPHSDPSFYYAVNRLLKQVAIERFGQECAKLSGQDWLNYLDSKLKSPIFLTQVPEFAQAPDDPTCRPDPELVMRCTQQWIGKHKC